ncbi:MAG: hypothetical protein GEU73_10815 [Chloroflexi bacterium]|nr:hypothetical protein [Chloroflexota bacterium]
MATRSPLTYARRRFGTVCWQGSTRGLGTMFKPRRRGRALVAALAAAILVAGCAAPGSQGAQPGGDTPQTTPKRITAVSTKGDPLVVLEKLEGAADTIQELVSGGLGMIDTQGNVHPEYAETIPSVENGLWKVLGDGSMEMTWSIREGARWQDGTPFTAEDLLFTIRVGQDSALPFGDPAYSSLDSVEALDARTVFAKWKQPYILAERMFTRVTAIPLPQHLLEPAYLEASASGAAAGFVEQRYWSEDYVGLGPYKISAWERGSHMVLDANEHYVLGRPKLDGIEVRFNEDVSAVVAAILGGGVDVTLGSGLEAEQVVELRNNWRDGQPGVGIAAFSGIIPQFLNPRPALVSNLEFRRALLMAINRQEMAETIRLGLVPVAHGYLREGLPEYQQLDAQLVKYPYDPNQAAGMIQSLGYQRGPDGTFHDAAGERLSVQLIADTGRTDERNAQVAIADYWGRIGVETELAPNPPRGDQEAGATFPAFRVRRITDEPERVAEFQSSQVPLPENRFRGRNTPRYQSPELDRLLERYNVTIPRPERMEVFGQVIRHISDQLVVMPIYYNVGVTAISNRLKNVIPRTGTAQAWRSFEWDVE